MGTALQNIDSLIRMPCGCGEQTMLGKFVKFESSLRIDSKTIDNRSSARCCHLRLLGESQPIDSGFKDKIIELHETRLSRRIRLQTQ